MSTARSEAGFTLVEALVALLLGAMVVSVVLSTVKIGAAAARRAEAAGQGADAFARAGAIIAGDALHARSLAAPEGPLFTGGPRAVTFAAAPRPAPGDGPFPAAPVLLRYDLRHDPDGSTLLRAQAPLDADNRPGAFAAPVTLWRAVGPAEFRYLDAQGRWRPQWDPARQARAMPRAIAVVTQGDGALPRLVGLIPDLVEPACALGPGAGCTLPAEAFP